MGRKKKDENPIHKYSKRIQDESIPLDIRVWLSILISTGCRPAEASEYKYTRKEKDILWLELPLKKKRRAMSRQVPIQPKIYGLKASDYKVYEGELRSLKTYSRWCKMIIGQNPRDYRHELSIFVLRRKNIVYVKEMLCHTDIRTTQHYLTGEKADFLEIAGL